MQLKIYSAPTNDISLSKAICDLAKFSDNKNENYLVIVPEKYSLSIEKMLLQKTGKNAICNIQVVTLSRLLHKLVKTSNHYLSAEDGVMVTKKIIIDNFDKLICFKKTARTLGFASEMYNTISSLKNSGVVPGDYKKMIEGLTQESLKIKIADIFLIYSEYEKFISQKYVDAADRFSLLSGLILQSDLVAKSNIYFVGHSTLSKSGLNVFEALLKTAKSLAVSCSNLSGYYNSYITKNELYDSVKEIASKNGIQYVEIKTKEGETRFANHIASNLFSYPYSTAESEDKIKLFSARLANEEIEHVAEAICKLVREGERYKHIAVACSDIDTYADIIRRVFDDYKIPIFIDKSENMINHPLSRFVVAAISMVNKNYNSSNVINFVKNAFSGFDDKEVFAFENYIIKNGTNYDSFFKPFVYGKESADYGIVENLRKNLISKISHFDKKLRSSSCVKDFTDAIALLIRDFDLVSAVQNFAELQLNLQDETSCSATNQALGKLNEICLSLNDLFGETKIESDEFLQILVSGLDATKISFIPATIDSCFVGDVSTSKYFEINELFVVGASECSLPAVKDDCGIILDKDISSISDSMAKKIEPSIKTVNRREKFKVFELMQVPKKLLCLSYSKALADGEESQPSNVIRDLKKIFLLNGNPIEVETRNDIIQKRQFFDKKQSIDSFAEEFATLSVASKKYISSVRNYKNNIQIEDNCALSSLGFVLQKKVDCRVKKAMLDVSNDKKQAELSNAKQLFFADSKTSISELECYFSCPYKHFAEYGLKIKERDEAKLKAVDVGNIMHKIAELFMRQISSFEKLEEKEFDKKVLSLVEYVMSQEKVSVAANKQIVAPLKSEAQRLCNALLYQYKNSSFRSSPEESEMRFGNGGTASGVKLKNGISIEGKIDRVDTTDKYLRVIDYKTGEYKLSASEVYYGKKIQLFVYLKALEKYKNLRLVGAFYFPIKDNFVEEKEENNYLDTYRLDGYYEKDVDAVKSMDNSLSFENPSSKIVNASISKSKENIKCGNFVLNSVKTTVVACGMISKINAYVKELAETATSEILDGFILPSPIFKDRLACDYCKYKLACGFSENAGDEPRIAQSSIKFENFVKEEE